MAFNKLLTIINPMVKPRMIKFISEVSFPESSKLSSSESRKFSDRNIPLYKLYKSGHFQKYHKQENNCNCLKLEMKIITPKRIFN